jgi:hypothetical protein
LGATAVAASARELEQALREGRRDAAPQLLERLCATLAPALAAAASLSQADPTASPVAGAAEPSHLAEKLATLGELLARHSLRARRQLAEIRPALIGAGAGTHAAAIEARLELLDFAGAEAALAVLHTTLTPADKVPSNA